MLSISFATRLNYLLHTLSHVCMYVYGFYDHYQFQILKRQGTALVNLYSGTEIVAWT